jgi:glycosyltransferase involved in cell wall biosynthesis
VYSYAGWVLDRNARRLCLDLARCGYVATAASVNELQRIPAGSYDAVVLVWWKGFPHAAIVAPVVYTCVYDHYTWKSPPWDAVFKEAMSRSTRVFASSNLLVSEISSVFGRTPEYMCDGVDTEVFCPEGTSRLGQQKVLRLGWCGNERGVKNVGALRAAIERVPGVVLVTADKGNPNTYVKPEDMPKWYRSLDAIVCVSTSEGTPNPVLEGAACGIPFISTPVGIVPELYAQSQGGVIVLGDDADSVENAIRTFKACYTLHASWGKRNREAAVAAWGWSGKFSPVTRGLLYDLAEQTRVVTGRN